MVDGRAEVHVASRALLGVDDRVGAHVASRAPLNDAESGTVNRFGNGGPGPSVVARLVRSECAVALVASKISGQVSARKHLGSQTRRQMEKVRVEKAILGKVARG